MTIVIRAIAVRDAEVSGAIAVIIASAPTIATTAIVIATATMIGTGIATVTAARKRTSGASGIGRNLSATIPNAHRRGPSMSGHRQPLLPLAIRIRR